MRRRLAPLAVVLLLAPAVHLAARSASRFESPLRLASSDARLVEAFSWAAGQASAYAFEGDEVGPWFEAALPGREAFCMRDVSHQAMGGHALGLQAHIRNMLGRFAENVTDARDWCSLWEIDRHNRPAHAFDLATPALLPQSAWILRIVRETIRHAVHGALVQIRQSGNPHRSRIDTRCVSRRSSSFTLRRGQ